MIRRNLDEANQALKHNFISRALLMETTLHWQSSDNLFLYTADCDGVPDLDNPQDMTIVQTRQLTNWQVRRLGRPDINGACELIVFDLICDDVCDPQLRVCRLEVDVARLGDEETRLALNAAMTTQAELGINIPDMLDGAAYDNAVFDLQADTEANFRTYDGSVAAMSLEALRMHRLLHHGTPG